MKTEYKITEQQHHWTSDEKLKFGGYGEWVEEADAIEFEYKGYEAFIIRIWKKEHSATEEAYFGGHLCGYVKIPKTHPYYGKEEIDLDVHGGLTFNEMHEEHFVGFDCAHSIDLVPTMDHLRKTMPELRSIRESFLASMPIGLEDNDWFNPKYRNIEYCINQCIHMIDQLVVVEEKYMRKKS